ncbi:MAG: adenine phosphoribosyltransferase [Deltaproteobacteria bacterium]|nr:MAG: adenine phosphoribosyltransferase [Deltaproteobacteria bacterium]
MEELKNKIRDVADFPKPGIIFKDLTPVLADVKTFQKTIDLLAKRYSEKGIDTIIGIESRGFIFGAPLAYRIDAGFVPVRKKGKLPYKTHSITYELEYGTDTLEIHEDAIHAGSRVLVVDDLLATGGTCAATCQLVEKSGGKVIECAFVVELNFLKGRDKLKGQEIFSLIQF